MPEEYSKEQLLRYLLQHSVDDKVSLDDLSDLVFDAHFPNHLFDKAKTQLQQTVKDWQRYGQLGAILKPKMQQLMEIERQIIALSENRFDNLVELSQLKKQRRLIEDEVQPLDEEFDALSLKLREIKGE
jgi:hypothetical protein